MHWHECPNNFLVAHQKDNDRNRSSPTLENALLQGTTTVYTVDEKNWNKYLFEYANNFLGQSMMSVTPEFYFKV